MKHLPVADAFRAIIRATHPERDDLQQIGSYRWFHDRQRIIMGGDIIHDQADAPAYAALDLLKAGVKSQKIRLRGILGKTPPADIDPIDAREGELDVFAATLKIYESKDTFRTARIYTSVHCSFDDVLTLLGMPLAEKPAQLKHPTDEMVRAKVRGAYSDEKGAGRRAPNINKIPKFVRPKLNAEGYDTSDKRIKNIADEDEFKALREPTGVKAT